MTYSYLARRILYALATLWGGVTLVFLAIHLIPGNPVLAILGDFYSPQAAADLTKQLGLDQPLWVQYGHFLRGLLSGHLGNSLITSQPVFPELMGNFQFTLILASAGALIEMLIGIPAGVISALNRGKLRDFGVMGGAMLGVSMPSFWLGILLMIAFSVRLNWLPMIGAGSMEHPLSLLLHVVLPALTLGIRGAALTARVSRSAMLEVLGEDYIRTARAKGLGERVVIYRHALRNALMPVVTVVGLDLGRMFGGTTVVETVFGRPGLGTLLIGAVLDRDYPTIQATFILYLAMFMIINLVVDLIYTRLDPRVVYS